MHPILSDKKKLIIYLSLWGVVGILTGFAISLWNGVPWYVSATITVPMLLLSGEVNLSAWYLCRAFPLERTPIWKILSVSASAVLIVSTAWSFFGWGMLTAVEHISAISLSPLPLQQTLFIIAVTGMPLYIVSLAVGYLIAAFERTKASEQSAYESRLLAQHAELKALRMQIDPHFLFNSLNSISALTTTNPELARTMTTTLADFFRTSLSYGTKETVTLKEELSLLGLYLDIEKIRFGKRLDVQQSVAPGASTDHVPPLLLQPLVENAIKHGISHSLEGGMISLSVQKKNDRLFITIENPVDVDAPKRQGTGMGIDIVRKRLRAIYGSDGDLKTSEGDNLFRVILFLPARKQ